MPTKEQVWLQADWPAPAHVVAGVSTRRGGVSEGRYQGLNLATHVGDEHERVKKNRALLLEILKIDKEPAWLEQVHGNRILELDEAPVNDNTADGCITRQTGLPCVVLTADCVPLLFCDRQGTQVGAIHAGWRGIYQGIIQRAVSLFKDPSSVMVWIGPCISQSCYEVGKDVFEAMTGSIADAHTAFEQTDAAHWQCDLQRLVTTCLQQSGVRDIYPSGQCTWKHPALFYSHRREGQTGRTASLIWME